MPALGCELVSLFHQGNEQDNSRKEPSSAKECNHWYDCQHCRDSADMSPSGVSNTGSAATHSDCANTEVTQVCKERLCTCSTAAKTSELTLLHVQNIASCSKLLIGAPDSASALRGALAGGATICRLSVEHQAIARGVSVMASTIPPRLAHPSSPLRKKYRNTLCGEHACMQLFASEGPPESWTQACSRNI